MSSGATYAGRFAAESAIVPFWLVVHHQRKFRCENPPFACKRQIPALHILQADVLSTADLADMFSQAGAEGSLAFGRILGCLPNINQLALEIQGIDSAGMRPRAFTQGKYRASLEFFNHLGSNATV